MPSLLISDHIKVVGCVRPPFLYQEAFNISTLNNPIWDSDRAKKSQRLGFEFEVLQFLALYLNFTFDLIQIHPSENKTVSLFDATIEALELGEAGLSISLFPLHEKAAALLQRNFTITYPLNYFTRGFLVREFNAPPASFMLDLPFTPKVWMANLLLIPTLVSLLVVSARVLGLTGSLRSISHNFWLILLSVAKPMMSFRSRRQNASQRCLILIWNFAKTILLTLYTQTLVAYFYEFPSKEPPFRSYDRLMELLASDKLKLVMLEQDLKGFSPNFSHLEYILEMPNGARILHEPIPVKDMASALHLVKNSNQPLALFAKSELLYVSAEQYDVCHFNIITEDVGHADNVKRLLYMIIGPNFPYTTQIRQAVEEIANTEFVAKIRAKYLDLENFCGGGKKFTAKKNNTHELKSKHKLTPDEVSLQQRHPELAILNFTSSPESKADETEEGVKIVKIPDHLTEKKGRIRPYRHTVNRENDPNKPEDLEYSQQASKKNSVQIKALRLINLFGDFWLLTIGAVSAAFLFIFEHFLRLYRGRNRGEENLETKVGYV